METLSVVQSLLIALWVAAVMSRWLGGGATLTLRFSPLMTGLVVGLIMGEVAQAMIVTAALQMIYMGVFSPGGSMPAEPSIAAAIAVPVALLGGSVTRSSNCCCSASRIARKLFVSVSFFHQYFFR